jgi:predicted phosphodiesterase
MGLEEMVKMERVMVVSDIHVPYQSDKAVALVKAYAKDYKPQHFVVNGDLVDFYGLSRFDKSPERKHSVNDELVEARKLLKEFRGIVGPKAKMYFVEGNHEQRLQRYLSRNPELADLPELKVDKLLHLKEADVKYVKVDGDYWAEDTGHVKFGDVVVLHGDSRLNGASTSRNAGYSAMNTMKTMGSSVVMGHVHRLATVYSRSAHKDTVGMEGGCLCKIPGNANWQQGFSTFEVHGGKGKNFRTHLIEGGKLYAPDRVYQV